MSFIDWWLLGQPHDSDDDTEDEPELLEGIDDYPELLDDMRLGR